MLNLLDLPKQIDAVVNGLIGFCYSIIDALWRMARAPSPGSLWLSRKRGSNLSSTTFLFVIAGAYALLSTRSEVISATLGPTPERKGGVVEFFVATTFHFIYLDLSARLAAWFIASPKRRERTAARLRFALGTTVAFCLIAISFNGLTFRHEEEIAAFANGHGLVLDRVTIRQNMGFVLLATIIASFSPIFALLVRLVSRRWHLDKRFAAMVAVVALTAWFVAMGFY